MSLDQLRRTWDGFAESDPWRAILGRPGEGEELPVEEFFLSGVYEIEEVMRYAAALGFPGRRQRALDFGCGAGRLTQALAQHFDQVTGVDVSPAMLDLAREHNRHGERCQYVLNDAGDLAQFEAASVDLIYSNITLQHLRPALIEAYLAEFLRVLAPQGLLLFQLPSHRRSPWLARALPGNLYQDASRFVWSLLKPGRPLIEMHAIGRRRVIRLLEQHGGRLLADELRDAAGPDWESYRYAVTTA
jgi:SAM-dependent methyltransferase